MRWNGPDAAAWWAGTEELIHLAASVARVQTDLARRVDAHARQQRRASLPSPERAVTLFDSRGDGRVVHRIGPGGASTVVILVPGVGTDLSDSARLRIEGERVWEAIALAAPSEVAVEAWLGYDPPDRVLGAVSDSAAVAGGRRLADHIDAARAMGAERVVLVGHSYGALTAAYASALRHPESAGPDELVLLGSPGLGVAVTDLRLRADAGLWAATARGDPISLVARSGLVHGQDPAQVARPLPTSLSGHGSYLRDQVLLEALSRVVWAREPRATVGP